MSSLKKVKPGDPLVIPAVAYNTFVDAALDYLDRRNDQAQEAHPAARHSGIVLVRNEPNPVRHAASLLVCTNGCSALLPMPDLAFSAHQRIVEPGRVHSPALVAWPGHGRSFRLAMPGYGSWRRRREERRSRAYSAKGWTSSR